MTALHSFAQNSYFTINGAALDYGTGEYLLTPASAGKVGSIWFNDKVSLKESFVLNFELYFGTKENGADGMTFCLQPVSTSIGVSGAGLGIQGVTPSFFAEFDTYQNGGDPTYDHVAIQKNGIVNNTSTSNLSQAVQIKNGLDNVEDGNWYPMQIRWDAGSKKFELYVDCEFRISYTGDIINSIFGGNDLVYWGFTASTGGANNVHKVRNITSTLVKIPDQTICKGSGVQINIPNTGNTFTWNTSEGVSSTTSLNPTLNPTKDMQYIISYSGFCNSEVKDTFNVTIDGSQLELGNDTTICDGTNLTLSATGGASYLWSNGKTASSITVSAAGNYSVTATTANGCKVTDDITVSSIDCSCQDSDGDGICDVDDLDDDNDGILDTVECPNNFISSAFSASGGITKTFTLPSADGGFNFDIYELDNSFNLEINGTKLVPVELQCQNDAWRTGQSKLVFTSDLSEFGVAGNDNIWVIRGDAINPVIRVAIQPNGGVKFYGKRKTSSALEPMNIRAGHAQANSITWNQNSSNEVILSMIVTGPTSISGSGSGIQLCTQDTDGDGTPDYLDIDSDGDGCPDAMEGGGGFKRSDLTGLTLSGAVDAYGVPVVAGASGQSLGTSADPTIKAIECGCTNDNDNDGVCDEVDLDDDNDGILDVNECMTSNFQWSAPPSVSGKTATGVINGVNYTYTSSINIETTPGIFAFNRFPTTYGIPNSTVIKNRFQSSNKITFSQPVLNPTLLFSSIGGGNSVPIKFAQPVEVLFQDGPVTIDSPTQITGKEGYIVLRINGIFSEISFDYLADENYVNFTFGADFASFCDTDGDGTSDYLDGDSDGDGCPDAMEGGGGFKLSELTGLTLSGAVDAYGVPLIASAVGQSIGTSIEKSKMASECITEHILIDTLSICEGDSIEIVGEGITTQVWGGTTDFKQINDSTIKVSPTTDAFYFVGKSTGNTVGKNVIANGDFEQGDIGFSSQYTKASGGMARGAYAVSTNPSAYNGVFGSCGDHTSGSGKMFITDASEQANVKIWCQTINTIVNTKYEFSAWVTSIFKPNPPILQFQVNGNLLGQVFNVEETVCDWQKFAATWNSGTTTSAEICIINQNTAGSGNDFAMDDISFAPVIPSSTGGDSVLVIVKKKPKLNLGNDTSICTGKTLTIGASTSGTFAWNTGENSSSIKVDSAGTYKLTVINSEGCSAIDSISIDFLRLPIVTIGNDTTICSGKSLTIDAGNTGMTYTWNTGEKTQVISKDKAGTYGLVVTDTEGCTSSDSLNLKIQAKPSVDLGADQKICIGEDISFDAGNQGLKFLWNTGETSQQIVASSSGAFGVVVSDSLGCLGSDSIILQVNLLPEVNLGNDTTICKGETVTLDAQNTGLFYNWTTGQSAQTIIINTSGVYAVEVRDSIGCLGSDSIQLTVNELPVVNLGRDTSICEWESITLDTETPNLTYIWNTGETSQSIVVKAEGKYEVTVADNIGCSGSDEINLKVDVVPDPFRNKNYEFCEGDTLLVSPFYYPSDDAFTWTVNKSASDSIFITKPGTYFGVVNSYHCSDSFAIQVLQNDTPDVWIKDLSDQKHYCFDYEYAQLEVQDKNGGYYDYEWVRSGDYAQRIEVKTSGFHIAKVSDEKCFSRVKIELKEYCDALLYIPNAFTPDGDGLNDEFRPLTTYVDDYQLLIYNRWGTRVFESTDPNEGWDGISNTGEVLNTAVFVYKLSYVYPTEHGGSEKKFLTGTVTLVR